MENDTERFEIIVKLYGVPEELFDLAQSLDSKQKENLKLIVKNYLTTLLPSK
jgi:hypothetical protein